MELPIRIYSQLHATPLLFPPPVAIAVRRHPRFQISEVTYGSARMMAMVLVCEGTKIRIVNGYSPHVFFAQSATCTLRGT